MNIEPAVASFSGPAEQFTGAVWGDFLATPHDPDQRMTVAVVRFAPGARTAWHSHARGQYLRVTQGVARLGHRDGTIIDVHPGQTVYTPPGEDHWHGAAGECFMEHIAMFEAADDPTHSTVWKEHVTDAVFRGHAASTENAPQR